MKRPVIGITTDSNDADDRYQSAMTYIEAVERAGGLPLLLPYAVDHSLIPQYVDLLDGICFSGGNDMNPVRYGEVCVSGIVCSGQGCSKVPTKNAFAVN